MNPKRLLCLLLTLCGLIASREATAQYYTWGSDPAGLKWSELRTDDVRIIYPDTARDVARRTLFCVEKVRPYIGYGFRHSAMRIPFVLHPENFRSNGLVMWLPKRVEFLTSPAVDGYSMPWYKQLTAHEYRHAVQYNNLNRGVIRFLSYVLGQQGSTVGLLCLPIWLMEGDAVMSETEMSSFGRGLQPRFTIEYRAMGNIARRQRNPDKWFCGSYRDFVPDHYQLGYQIASYSYTRFNQNVWDKVAWYGSRNPYLFFTTSISLKKFYRTSVTGLFRETFDDLNRYWDSLPRIPDSTTPLTPLPLRNHTTYAYPLEVNDSLVVAMKSDLDHPSRLIAFDASTGRERRIAYTGDLSTRPAYGDGRIWWTEYRRSLLFEQRVNSVLCYLDLDEGTPRTVARARNILYPTPTAGGLAWVEYNPDSRYTIVWKRDGGEERRFAAPFFTEIHSLAWDGMSDALYFIATDDTGMWIGTFDEKGSPQQLTQGAYITLSDLRAREGKLYFGSIASGRDEAHCFDIASRREYRITASTYGSFSPAPTGKGGILATTYSARGYALSAQDTSGLVCVAPSHLPLNLVNPPRRRWEVINLDTVRFTPADSLHSLDQHPVRRYRKGLNLVNVHSWMPVAFNPFEAVDEQRVSLNWGATLISQNLLSNTEAFFSYGWNKAEKSLLRLGVRYFGLGVQFDIDGAYGGNQIVYSLKQQNPHTGKPEYQHTPATDKYYSVGITATLPLVFQRGYHTRRLSLSAGWNFSNGMVADLGRIRYDDQTHSITNLAYIGYTHGLHKVVFAAGFSDYVRLATRDFLPRLGYAANVSYAFNPSNNNFSDLIAGYVRFYLPGFFAHHSFSAAASYQTSLGGFRTPEGQRLLTYNSSYLIPKGFSSSDIRSNRYLALAADYQLPIWYPEGGIPSVLYFKRIRLNAGFGYAQFREIYGVQQGSGKVSVHSRHRRLWSYGGDLIFDVNVFRQPAAATSTFRLSLYKPVCEKGLWFSAGVGLPF